MANDKEKGKLIDIQDKLKEKNLKTNSQTDNEEPSSKSKHQDSKIKLTFEKHDDYNRIRNYRRQNDKIVFYYNLKTNEKIILAVKPGDNLSEPPFLLKEDFVVTEKTLREGLITSDKGMVHVTEESLAILKKLKVLTDETAYVIHYNRKNVGFYL